MSGNFPFLQPFFMKGDRSRRTRINLLCREIVVEGQELIFYVWKT